MDNCSNSHSSAPQGGVKSPRSFAHPAQPVLRQAATRLQRSAKAVLLGNEGGGQGGAFDGLVGAPRLAIGWGMSAWGASPPFPRPHALRVRHKVAAWGPVSFSVKGEGNLVGVMVWPEDVVSRLFAESDLRGVGMVLRIVEVAPHPTHAMAAQTLTSLPSRKAVACLVRLWMAAQRTCGEASNPLEGRKLPSLCRIMFPDTKRPFWLVAGRACPFCRELRSDRKVMAGRPETG